jgi:hypothetical protein
VARDRTAAATASACDTSAPAQLVEGAIGVLRTVGVAAEVEPYRAAWIEALDRYAHDADELRSRVCSDAPPDREDRVRCIDGGVREVALQVGLAAHGDRERLARLLRTRVPAAPFECTAGKAGVAAALVALHSDARPVAEARLLLLDNRVDEAARLAATTGFAPLQQEIAIVRARVAGDVERMRDTAVAADRAGHVLAAAELWLAISVGEAETDGKRARDLLAQTELALERAGNPPFERATWLAAKAYVAAMTDAAATDRFVDEAEHVLARLPFDALTYARLGAAEIRAGHFERGAALHRRAYEAVAGRADSDPTVRFVRIAYAGSLNATGQPAAGRELLEPLLRGAAVSERDLQAAATLATAYSQLGRDAEILAVVERYRAPIEAGVGRSGPALRLLTLEASAAYSLGQHERAHGACRTTLDHHLTALGPDAYDTGDVRVLCGQIEIELGRLDEGRRAIEQGLATLVKTAGAADPMALEGRLALGDVLLRQHRDADALRELEATVEPYRAVAPPEGAAKAELLLARALAATRRDLPRARALAEHAIHTWSADPASWRRQLAEARALAKRIGRTSE